MRYAEQKETQSSSERNRHQGFRLFKGFLLFLLFSTPMVVQAEAPLHHEIQIALSPISHELKVVDHVTLPVSLQPDKHGRFHFFLREGLIPQALTAGVKIDKASGIVEAPVTIKSLKDGAPPLLPESQRVTHYSITLPIGLRAVDISYQGLIHHAPPSHDDEISQKKAHPLGIISQEGIFLSGKSKWYPDFKTGLLTFSLNISLPQTWSAVSQGERTENRMRDQSRLIRWESLKPQKEIFLVGGEWTEYQRNTGRVLAMAFLKNPDSGLANRYLRATEQYLEMYQKLLGPYPYKKFALVENFWEKGYGMPSFTLLNPKTLRLPLALNPSYSHELLHNWWGNGVYVDERQGDWSEGLTRYLSEYLTQEGDGTDTSFRRAALQKYADYVSTEKDFPLHQLEAHQDAASQAIAHGKTLFLFHMLRQSLGDQLFIEALQTFFHENKFKRASFEDLSLAFSRVAKRDLSAEFMQWVKRPRAPIIRAKHVRSEKIETGYLLTAEIEQRQWGSPFQLNIPISISLHGRDEAYQTILKMDDKVLEMSLVLPARPIRLKIDPEYDLFRRLHPAEMPPTLSRVFAAESTLILLPSTASLKLKRAYQKLAQSMQQDQPEQISIGWDNEYKTLPDDLSIWLFGWENRFQRVILKQLRSFGVSTNSAMTRIGDVQIPRRGHSLVLTARHPKKSKHSLSWLATDHAGDLPALQRKLPHYGDFGFLAFSGDTARNVEKGRWPTVGSPMSIRIKQGDGRWVREKPASLVKRAALTKISPLFSENRMWQDIAALSHPKMKGRGFGTEALDRAAEYIASEFRKIGLSPAGDSGRSYLQQWRGHGGGIGSGVALKNVVAVLPGNTLGLSNEYLVIGAHYDHLGFGWPRVHKGDEGKLHPGANGNASGVALLLELARLLKEDQTLKRSILFVAFTGKEVGLRGSKYLLAAQKSSPARRIVGMLNLDTIGRLQKNKLHVFGTGSSREWAPILRRVGVARGVEVASDAQNFGTSDQLSFIQRGIPAIQFFTGLSPHLDRPTDTISQINLPGMVSVGRVAKEVIKTLSNRPKALSAILLKDESSSLIWERRDK